MDNGQDKQAQIGQEEYFPEQELKLFDDDGNRVVIQRIECGHHHSLILDSDGNLYAFGMGG